MLLKSTATNFCKPEGRLRADVSNYSIGLEEFFVLLLPTLYWCFDQMVGLRVGIALLLANSTNAFFKFLMQGPRPYWISEKVRALSHETSFGIPSGHAQIAASVWGWLAVEVNKRWFKILSVIIIFMIGFSRLYLGVHFLSDVPGLDPGLLRGRCLPRHKPMGAWQAILWARIGLIAASAPCSFLLLAQNGWQVLGVRLQTGLAR